MFNCVLCMPKYAVNECLRWMLHVFFVNMICLEKLNSSVSQTGCSSFYGCAEKIRCSGLPNQTVRFWQTEYMVLSIFLWTTYHVHHVLLVYTHTHFCCTLQMHTYRGNSLGFPWKMCKMSSLGQIWIPFNMHIFRGSQLYMYGSKNSYWMFFESFNQGLSSITKKGEIKSASRPLVDFGVLNDNLIKWLISCVRWISRF
jgi:hypothetical protein